MCYPKPGPRCAHHLTQRIESLTQRLEKETDGDKKTELYEKLAQAKKEMLLTPQGIERLKEKAKNAPAGEKIHQLVLDSQRKRARLISMSKEQEKYQKSTIETLDNERDYSSQIDALNRVKLPKDTESFTPVGLFLIGSRLYGTHHSESDYDYVMVYTNNSKGHGKHKNKSQLFAGDDDVQRLSLGGFLAALDKGSPNTVEMLNARVRGWGQNQSYKQFLDALRPNYGKAYLGMREEMKNYVRREKPGDEEKSTRHLFRIALNGAKLAKTGAFNPTHSPRELDYLNSMMEKYKNKPVEQRVDESLTRMDKGYTL